MNGYFLLNKPKGISSFYALIKARDSLARDSGIPFKKIKMGHAGTLDPLAQGVLLCAIGKSTKILSHLLLSDKKYRTILHLGQISETDDDEGEKKVPEYFSHQIPTKEKVEKIIKRYIGKIEQIPPVFSALKIEGKRACDRTRAGEKIVMKKREVEIFSIEIEKYEYPFLTLSVHCGTGTYIRSLARDIGKDLQQGAFLSFLERTHIGDFSIENAKDPFSIKEKDILSFKPHHFTTFSHLIIDEKTMKRFQFGQKVNVKDIENFSIFRNERNNNERNNIEKDIHEENIHRLIFWTDEKKEKKEKRMGGMGEKKGDIIIPRKILI